MIVPQGIYRYTHSQPQQREKYGVEDRRRRNSKLFFSSNQVPVHLQPVSCRNTYLPGEKLHLKDLQKRNRHRAQGWPETIKKRFGIWREKKKRKERGARRWRCGDSSSRSAAVRHINSLEGSAAEMLREAFGDGQTQHHHNFHFSVCNLR